MSIVLSQTFRTSLVLLSCRCSVRPQPSDLMRSGLFWLWLLSLLSSVRWSLFLLLALSHTQTLYQLTSINFCQPQLEGFREALETI